MICDEPKDLSAPIKNRAVKQWASKRSKAYVSRGKTTKRFIYHCIVVYYNREPTSRAVVESAIAASASPVAASAAPVAASAASSSASAAVAAALAGQQRGGSGMMRGSSSPECKSQMY